MWSGRLARSSFVSNFRPSPEEGLRTGTSNNPSQTVATGSAGLWKTGRVFKLENVPATEGHRHTRIHLEGVDRPVVLDFPPVYDRERKVPAVGDRLKVLVVEREGQYVPVSGYEIEILRPEENVSPEMVSGRICEAPRMVMSVLQLWLLEIEKPLSFVSFEGEIPGVGDRISAVLIKTDGKEIFARDLVIDEYAIPVNLTTKQSDDVKLIFTHMLWSQPNHEGTVGDCYGELKAVLGRGDHGRAGICIKELALAGFIEAVRDPKTRAKLKRPPPPGAGRRNNHSRDQQVWRVLKLWPIQSCGSPLLGVGP